MRIIMMGTGGFAVPTFRELYRSRHPVLALVTQPARTSRGRPAPRNPMRELAEQHGTPVLDPEIVNTDEVRAALAEFAPDLLVVADYGQILSRETLAVARYGGVNLHGSLLPKYRGAAPINWAILNGDTESGVTTIYMTPQIDAGPCLAQASLAIDPDENAVELETRLAELGAPLVVQTIERIEADEIVPIPQDPALKSRAPRLTKADGAIDWSRSATQIKNQIRAMEPWPKTYTFWQRRDTEPLRLIVAQARVLTTAAEKPPGIVIAAGGGELIIATGDGHLAIEQIQPAGKRILTTQEFLNGYGVQPGDTFGPEAD